METYARKLLWEEVQESAKEIFNVWLYQPELKWAEKTWAILEEQGMTAYTDAFEYHSVVFRLLALGAIYHSFCFMAWDESPGILPMDWMDPFETDPSIIGQMYGWEESAPLENVHDAIQVLLLSHKQDVVNALIQGFGSKEALYASLWKSRFDKEEFQSMSEEELPWNYDPWRVSYETSKAFEWVLSGCEIYFQE